MKNNMNAKTQFLKIPWNLLVKKKFLAYIRDNGIIKRPMAEAKNNIKMVIIILDTSEIINEMVIH